MNDVAALEFTWPGSTVAESDRDVGAPEQGAPSADRAELRFRVFPACPPFEPIELELAKLACRVRAATERGDQGGAEFERSRIIEGGPTCRDDDAGTGPHHAGCHGEPFVAVAARPRSGGVAGRQQDPSRHRVPVCRGGTARSVVVSGAPPQQSPIGQTWMLPFPRCRHSTAATGHLRSASVPA